MGTTIGQNARIVSAVPDAGSAVERALDGLGATTDAVGTAEACLEHLSSADCVVLSDALPDRDVVELCAEIRRRRPALPIVVYPAAGSESLAGAVVAAGADAYVPRAQGTETLVERVRSVLGPSEPAAPSDGRAASPSSSTDDATDRLESLVDRSPLAIVEWTLEEEVRNWNAAATELFGYNGDEAIGESIVELLVPERDREATRGLRETVVEAGVDGEPFCRVDRNVRKDGTTITCEWIDVALAGDASEGTVLSIVRDVTEDRKRANALEALHETTYELMRAETAAEIADVVMTATEDVIDRTLAGIRLYDEDTDRLELAGLTSALDEYTDEIAAVGPGDSIFWEAYAEREPMIVDSVSAERIPYDIETEIGNSILQPLGDHGLFTVAASRDDELDDAEINLIHVLATTAEAALDRTARERELERAKTVVETVGDCVYQLDAEGRFVTVNDSMIDTTDYDREQLLGEHVSMVLTDESVERGRRRVRDLLADDDRCVATYEVTLVGSDGERTPVEVTSALLRSDGDFDGTVSIARDVSDRKRIERELVDRKAKIEGLHDVVSRLEGCDTREEIYELTVEAAETVLDFDGCCIDRVDGDDLVAEAASPGLEADLTGRRPVDDSIAGTTYRSQRVRRIGDTAAADETCSVIGDRLSLLSVPIDDRGVFSAVATESDAFTSADEELAELLLSHVSDALDRIAFEERLRAERDRFMALFENVPDGVISVTNLEDGPIVERANPAFERLFGYEEDEIVESQIDRVIDPPDRMADAETLNRRGNRGEISTAEVKRQTADGMRDFRLRVVPIETDGSSDRAFALYTDITAQKQRQKRLEILNRVLRHDLRNGMNIIDGCAEMLADAVDDADRKYAEMIQDRTDELIDLAAKTRTVERILDRDEIATGPIDLNAAIERAISRLENEYPAADVSCSLPEGSFARADEYLQTAVFQILENAAEHSDRTRPSIDVTLRDCPDDEFLSLSIADDGPGIPADERELLEGEREITQLRHASGLGLWLVNWAVTQTGGELTFSDNDPRGTVVSIEIPRANVESIAAAFDGTAAGD